MHKTYLTVRGYELDSYGHVNNAVYLQYLEQARWEIMKEMNLLDYLSDQELLMVVIETRIRYIREACLFDELVVETDIQPGSPFVIFRQRIRNQKSGLLVSRASVKTILIDTHKMARDLPEEIQRMNQD